MMFVIIVYILVPSLANDGAFKPSNLTGLHFLLLCNLLCGYSHCLPMSVESFASDGLQPMLQELGKQNPQLLRLIQDHHAEFLQLINEPADNFEG